MADDGTRRYFALLHFETATIEIKVFVIVKTFSSFFNYASSTTLAIALNVSPRERKRVVLLLESVQISSCGFVCELKESWCYQISGWYKANLRPRPRKVIFLLFSKIESFWGIKISQITYLPKSYLWTKNERNWFFNSCHSMLDIPSDLKTLILSLGCLWLNNQDPVLN